MVEAHFDSEANGWVGQAAALYTYVIVGEVPSWNIVLYGKQTVADNYRQMVSGFKDEEFGLLYRFATEDRVVDDGVRYL